MKNTSSKAFEFTHKHCITKKTPCVKFKVSMSLALASGSFKMNKAHINKHKLINSEIFFLKDISFQLISKDPSCQKISLLRKKPFKNVHYLI